MYTLVVYDTQFGNTEKIARAIGNGLGDAGLVRIAPVAEAEGIDLTGVDLLVVGGPTQGHRARQSLRDYVEHFSRETLQHLSIAAFDTRLAWPLFLSGSAANTIDHIIQRKRLRLAVPPKSFIVSESEGPLADGELERATEWAKGLALKVGATLTEIRAAS